MLPWWNSNVDFFILFTIAESCLYDVYKQPVTTSYVYDWIIFIEILVDQWKPLHKSNNMIAILATVLANGLRDQGSIPGRIIQKNEKVLLYAYLPLSIIRYASRVSGVIKRKM